MSTITVPGFKFAGVACGLKKSRKKDLALILSERPATAAALFTTCRVKAAPVIVGMRHLRRGKLQAVVINSGNANACTGARGIRDAEKMCREVARRLGIAPDLVLPSSTSIIGVGMAMEKVKEGIAKAVAGLSPACFEQAAEAIVTTDRCTKIFSTSCVVGGKKVRLAGMAKGAGMIAPKMATMLAYVFTDAAVERRCLRAMVRKAADESFHSITVDGDMSTNDTILLLANGLAENLPVRQGSDGEQVLMRAVKETMKRLAIKLVEDGEGATKLVEVRVEGARSEAAAKKVAFSVANSKLVKTAFFGEDPNFGRVMAAVGYAGVPIEAEKIDVSFDRVIVVRRGVGVTAHERQASRVLKQRSFKVKIQLRQGHASASVWTSDLSHEYVRINSAYRT